MSTKPPTNSLSLRLAGPEAVTPERSLAFFRENRDFFARWDPPRPPVFYTPERQRRYLLEETAENAAGTALYRYLCRPGEEEILGYLHLTGVEQGPPGPTAELGYKLARSAAGQGLMTAAVRQLLAEGRGRLGLMAVTAAVHPENLPSRRLLERLGAVCTADSGEEMRYLLSPVLSH